MSLFLCESFLSPTPLLMVKNLAMMVDKFDSTAVKTYKFEKSKRLLTPTVYACVFKKTSFKVHQPHLLFFVRLHDVDGTVVMDSRLGLAITKKKVKRANERNRIKRLSREYFRLHQADFSHKLDVVVTVKQTTKSLTNAQITDQLHQGFYQINQKVLKKLSMSDVL